MDIYDTWNLVIKDGNIVLIWGNNSEDRVTFNRIIQ